jgi:hypothetical protein
MSGSKPNQRGGPRALSDILGDLFAVRGYGRLQARRELEEAWEGALGDPGRRLTRLGDVRRGVLSVTVAHSTLLEELASFQKPALLAALRRTSAGSAIQDIRFRVGPIGDEAAEARAETQPRPRSRSTTSTGPGGRARTGTGSGRTPRTGTRRGGEVGRELESKPGSERGTAGSDPEPGPF